MSSTRGKTGVATRWTRQEKINTLYGPRVLKCRCSKCREVRNDTDFYHENKKYSKHTQKTYKKALPKCVICDDGRRGVDGKVKRRKEKGIFVDKSLQPIPTVDQFMI
jgi:hypothetical protein